MLGMYGPPHGLEPRLPPPTSEAENKPLNLQVNGHSKDKMSEGSRSDDDADVDADVDDDVKLSDDDRPDDDLDESYDSSDEYHSGESAKMRQAAPPGNPFTADNGDTPYADFESFVVKFNTVVRALVDTAKSMERRIGDEKNELSDQLAKEKERRQELEKEMHEEKKKREVTPPITERSSSSSASARRDAIYDTFASATHHTPTSSAIKFPFHSMVSTPPDA
ncbi:uncharacterized protein LOC101858626 [Aplysia californica]|uniref:Uncharacterized protein LOC101858626 n=1 Tax=Aplysia californica TaxID=6500 RepID=A0ABM0JNC0_APLCA|nr:uncharacterized protein LOC101858626 [Aplysia californica]